MVKWRGSVLRNKPGAMVLFDVCSWYGRYKSPMFSGDGVAGSEGGGTRTGGGEGGTGGGEGGGQGAARKMGDSSDATKRGPGQSALTFDKFAFALQAYQNPSAKREDLKLCNRGSSVISPPVHIKGQGPGLVNVLWGDVHMTQVFTAHLREHDHALSSSSSRSKRTDMRDRSFCSACTLGIVLNCRHSHSVPSTAFAR